MVNPGFFADTDPTVHLFDGSVVIKRIDERTGELEFSWAVQNSDGFIETAPIVSGYFEDPTGAVSVFETVPVTDVAAAILTIVDTVAGTYTVAVTHISVEGAGYDPDANEISNVLEGFG